MGGRGGGRKKPISKSSGRKNQTKEQEQETPPVDTNQNAQTEETVEQDQEAPKETAEQDQEAPKETGFGFDFSNTTKALTFKREIKIRNVNGKYEADATSTDVPNTIYIKHKVYQLIATKKN